MCAAPRSRVPAGRLRAACGASGGSGLTVGRKAEGLLAADEDGEADDGDDELADVDQQVGESHVRRSPWSVA